MISAPQSDKTRIYPHAWRETAVRLVSGLFILLALVLLARDSAQEIAALESWVAGLGHMGSVVFILAVVVLTSVFVPSSVLAALAGAMFGLLWGTLAMTAGILLAAALDYLLARKLLCKRIETLLQGYPKLQAIQRAVRKEGVYFQVMLRLAPINAVTVNYVLGAAGVRFPPFLIAILGTIPGTFVEVYFGHMAKHISKIAANSGQQSHVETAVTVVGFLVCVVLLILIGRKAQQVIADAGAADPSTPEA